MNLTNAVHNSTYVDRRLQSAMVMKPPKHVLEDVKELKHNDLGPQINLIDFCQKREVNLTDLLPCDHKAMARISISCCKDLMKKWLCRRTVNDRRDEYLTDFMRPLKPYWCTQWEFDVSSPQDQRQMSAIAHAEVAFHFL